MVLSCMSRTSSFEKKDREFLLLPEADDELPEGIAGFQSVKSPVVARGSCGFHGCTGRPWLPPKRLVCSKSSGGKVGWFWKKSCERDPVTMGSVSASCGAPSCCSVNGLVDGGASLKMHSIWWWRADRSMRLLKASSNVSCSSKLHARSMRTVSGSRCDSSSR